MGLYPPSTLYKARERGEKRGRCGELIERSSDRRAVFIAIESDGRSAKKSNLGTLSTYLVMESEDKRKQSQRGEPKESGIATEVRGVLLNSKERCAGASSLGKKGDVVSILQKGGDRRLVEEDWARNLPSHTFLPGGKKKNETH